MKMQKKHTCKTYKNTKLKIIIYKHKTSEIFKKKMPKTKQDETKIFTKILLSSFCVGVLLLDMGPTLKCGV